MTVGIMAITPQRGGGGSSPRKSWKGGQTTASPSRKTRGSDWTRAGAPRRPRWLAAIPLVGIAATLLAAFVYYLVFIPRPTPLICVYVSEYEAPLLPQSFAREDVERFITLFPYAAGDNSKNLYDLPDQERDALKYTGKEEFLNELAQLVAKDTGP